MDVLKRALNNYQTMGQFLMNKTYRKKLTMCILL